MRHGQYNAERTDECGIGQYNAECTKVVLCDIDQKNAEGTKEWAMGNVTCIMFDILPSSFRRSQPNKYPK